MKKEEQETILTYDPMTDEWTAWTCVAKHANALKKKNWTVVKEDEEQVTLKAKGNAVRFADPENKRKTHMSEEQRAELGKRLAAARQAKNL